MLTCLDELFIPFLENFEALTQDAITFLTETASSWRDNVDEESADLDADTCRSKFAAGFLAALESLILIGCHDCGHLEQIRTSRTNLRKILTGGYGEAWKPFKIAIDKKEDWKQCRDEWRKKSMHDMTIMPEVVVQEQSVCSTLGNHILLLCDCILAIDWILCPCVIPESHVRPSSQRP